MRDAGEVEALLHRVVASAWEDERYRDELTRSPELVVEREVLRAGAATDSIAACVELLAGMPPCPDTFASRADDLFFLHEHVLGG